MKNIERKKINEVAANNVYLMRKNKGMTKKFVSEGTNIKYGTYGKVEANKKIMTFAEAVKIAEFYNVKLEDFKAE